MQRACVLVLAIFIFIAAVPASSSYELVDLGPGVAAAVSNNGAVVGTTGLLAYIWAQNQTQSLGKFEYGFDASYSTAFAVNDAGTVVGSSGTYDLTSHGEYLSDAFIYLAGKLSGLLGTPSESGGGLNAAADQQAFGINARGVAVGVDGDRGFALLPGVAEQKMPPLSKLGDTDATVATAIDDRNDVTGASTVGTAPDKHNVEYMHAVLWKNAPHGTVVDLGTVPGYPDSVATAINASGQIVGYASKPKPLPALDMPFCMQCAGTRSPGDVGISDVPHNSRAMLWKNGGRQILSLRAGAKSSAAFGINDAGAIVGTSGNHAVMWMKSRIRDLNDFIPAGSGWTLTHAMGINNHGWIVGAGVIKGAQHGFLLVPRQSASQAPAVPELHRVATLLSQPFWGAGAFAVSPDGRTVAMAAPQSTIVLYDTRTGTRIRTLPAAASALAFSPDGASLVAAANQLTVIDVATGSTRWTIDGVNLNAVAFSADGKAIAAGGSKPLVGLYDAQTGAVRWQHDGGSIVFAVAVDPTSTYVASGSEGGGLRVWNFDGGVQSRGLTEDGKLAHYGRVLALAFKDRETLLSGGGDGNAKVWNVATGALLRKAECVDYVASIAIRADGAIAYACTAAGPVVTKPGMFESQRSLADGTLGTLRIGGVPGGWWVEGGDQTLKFYRDGLPHATTVSGVVQAVAFSDDRRWYAYSLGDRPIHVRRVADRTDFATVYGLESSRTQILNFSTTLAIDPVTHRVAAATYTSQGGPDHQGAYDPHLVIVSFDGRVLLSRQDLPAGQLKFTDDGTRLVTQSPNYMADTPWTAGVVTIANAAVAVQSARATELQTSTIGPDDTPSLVANLHDRIVRLALPSLRPIRSFALRGDGSPVALSPDGRSLLSLGQIVRILHDGVLRTAPFDLGETYHANFDLGNRALAILNGGTIELRSAITAQLTAKAIVPPGGRNILSAWALDDPTALYLATEGGIEEWSAGPSQPETPPR